MPTRHAPLLPSSSAAEMRHLRLLSVAMAAAIFGVLVTVAATQILSLSSLGDVRGPSHRLAERMIPHISALARLRQHVFTEAFLDDFNSYLRQPVAARMAGLEAALAVADAEISALARADGDPRAAAAIDILAAVAGRYRARLEGAPPRVAPARVAARMAEDARLADQALRQLETLWRAELIEIAAAQVGILDAGKHQLVLATVILPVALLVIAAMAWAVHRALGRHLRAVGARARELEGITDALPYLVAFIDRNGCYQFVNHAYSICHDRPKTALVGRRVADLYPADIRAAMVAQLDRAMAGEVVRGEVQLTRADGTACLMERTYLPRRAGDGAVVGVFALLRDITARDAANRRSRANQKQLKAILDSVADAVITIDDQGIVQAFNPAAQSMFGYPAAAVLGRNIKMLIPSGDAERHDGYLRAYCRTGRAGIIGIGREVFAQRADGSEFPLHLTVTDVALEGQRLFTGILRDLSQEYDSRRRLRILSRAIENSPAAVVVASLDGRIDYVNDSFAVMSGYDREEVCGRSLEQVAAQGASPGDDDGLWAALRAGRPWQGEFDNWRKDGRRYRVAAKIAPINDERGRISHYVAVEEDVTAQRSAERRLRDSEARFRAVFERSDISMALVAEDGRLLAVNDALCRAFGAGRASLLGIRFDVGLPPEDVRGCQALYRRLWAGRLAGDARQVEQRFLTGSGEVIWGLLSVSLIRDDAGVGQYCLAQVQVVTDLVEARRALKDLYEHAPNPYVTLAPATGRVLRHNAALGRLLGYTRAELAEKHVGDFCALGAEGRDRMADILARSRAGLETHGAELRLARKGGGNVWVSLSVVPYIDERGRHVENRSILSDISAIKHTGAALARATEAALAANRAKSDFMSRMSHELRTPLHAVLGFTQLLRDSRRDPPSERQRRQLDHILESGRHLRRLIDEVLDLAQIEAGRVAVSPEAVTPRTVLDECVSAARALAAPREITIHDLTREQDLPELYVDRLRMAQVMLNLLSNAVKYNHDRGEVWLRARCRAGRLRLTVTDSGPGIPEARRAGVFVPFDRLGAEHSDVEGSGIGLALSKELVELMGGAIGLESGPDGGATFWVDLPRAIEAGEAAGRPAPTGGLPLAAPGGRRTVLYVEDNPASREVMCGVAEHIDGLRLVCARSAEEGLETLTVEIPDLVLLDINLPGIDGFEALRRLKDHRGFAGRPVVALSADATPGASARARAAGFDAYITKPIDLRAFTTMLGQCWGADHDRR